MQNTVERKHIVLSEDPKEALRQISDFLEKNMKIDDEHRFPVGADKRSFDGYWQDVDFFYNLQAIRHYAGNYGSSAS